MLERYLIIGLGAFLIGFSSGAVTNGWRYEAKISAIQKQNAEAAAKAHKDSETLSLMLSEATKQHYKELDEVRHANKVLSDAVARDSMRLRVKAHCVSKAAPGGSVDNAGAAELAGDARRAYFAHLDAITLSESMLKACQDALRLERK